MKSLYAADIRENQPIDDLFLVAQKNHGVTKGGSSYLTLKLLDRSGEIEARLWDRADDLGRGFERNDFVRVRGQPRRSKFGTFGHLEGSHSGRVRRS